MRALLELLRRVLSGSSLTPPGTAGPLRQPGADAGNPRVPRVPRVPRGPSAQRPGGGPPRAGTAYPGDFHGVPTMTYAPKPDGRPDPGEVVWTWVPYEEDHAQGKDRPVLLIGRDGPWLLGLPLTSKDHDRDEIQERRRGRLWCDIGSGDWDPRGRSSEVRVNRIVRVDESSVRREGAVLARARFEAVAQAVRSAQS